jgi:hypothetical protein
MAVGLPAKTTYVDGDVFSASDINDTNGTLNLVGQTTNFYAGKNRIINGDFGIWQRGTSITPATSAVVFVADRWNCNRDGSGATVTVTRQSFTPGAAPEAGYESLFFLRFAQSVAGTGGNYNGLAQRIEDVTTFANQTMTVSFWAKADAARTVTVAIDQNFGSGGSTTVTQTSTVTLTTSWVRYTKTFTLASLTGKTIGTGSYLQLFFNMPLNTVQTIDYWGVQVEAGSTATAFETASGSVGGELALCQRYYEKSYAIETAPATTTFDNTIGAGTSATFTYVFWGNQYYKTTKRVAPTVTLYNPSTGLTTNQARNISTSTNIPIVIHKSSIHSFNAYVDNTSFAAGNILEMHFIASAEL